VPDRIHASSARDDGDASSQSEFVAPQDALLTVGEVARRLRVDTTTVRRWISQGILEAVILPHRGKRQAYRIRQRTLDQLLQASASTNIIED
jgi:excisionase family DNA binding protein